MAVKKATKKAAKPVKVVLGRRYKDSISGFEGVAIARAKYLYGCVRVLIAPTSLKKDGDFLPDGWFDEPQLISVRTTKAINKKKDPKEPAGPARAVPPSRDPI